MTDQQHAADVAYAVSEGAPADLLAAIDALTDEQRRALFFPYCAHCGAIDSNCFCCAHD